jgi:hypothetical protein
LGNHFHILVKVILEYKFSDKDTTGIQWVTIFKPTIGRPRRDARILGSRQLVDQIIKK